MIIPFPDWECLTPSEQIDELRLDSASRYYDAFRDDPCTIMHCPDHGPQTITARSTACDQCGRELAQPQDDPDDYREWWAA